MFTPTTPRIIIFGTRVASVECLLLTKSHVTLFMWSRDVKCQKGNAIAPFQHDLHQNRYSGDAT